MPHSNQYRPCPPIDLIREPLIAYFSLGINDAQIVDNLSDHYDTERYGLSVVSLRRMRKELNLKRTRQQCHTFESIADKVRAIRERFPRRGAGRIRRNLREQHGDHVPRELINDFLKIVEPAAVAQRKKSVFKRRRYWSAGVNDAWCQDQHDKWGRFGLWLHASLDSFTGSMNWVNCWWTNKNPKLISSYYFACVRREGGVPLVTQSDPGPENYGVANAQTYIRHRLDPSLEGTRQHRFSRHHQNILSEIKWSVFRRDFAPGFEDILEKGVHEGWYNVDDVLENLVFRWLAIPWMQAEINIWVRSQNSNAPRADRHKILPHGIPSMIRSKPHKWGALDFKIPVPAHLIDAAEAEFAPPDDPVFQLVPPLFDTLAHSLYAAIGSPAVSSLSLWDVYRALLLKFRQRGENPQFDYTLSVHRETLNSLQHPPRDPIIPLDPNMQEFETCDVRGPRGFRYVGGKHRPPTIALRNVTHWDIEVAGQESGSDVEDAEAVDFTDSENEADEPGT